MLTSVRLFGLAESLARSWLCFASPCFMSLIVALDKSKFYLHIIIELEYLSEMISHSLILHKQYYVYLQLLLAS